MSYKRKRVNILFLLLLFIFSACEKNDSPDNSDSLNRVVLFYISAEDRELGIDATEKIEAILEGWNSSINGKIVIFNDSFKQDPELFEVVSDKNGNQKKIIRQYEEIDSANPETLASVINDLLSLKEYKCDSYGLIIFSHASGWLPPFTLKSPRSFETNGILRSITNDNGNQMELVEFVNVIPKDVFDFIIFETCLMAGIEICYELKDKTDYILASSAEIISPGFAEAYRKSLPLLFTKNADLSGFAKNIYEYFDQKSSYWRSSTLSLIKTSELEKLGTFISENVNVVEQNNVDLTNIQSFYSNHLFLDFEDYFSTRLNQNKIEELNSIIDKCVVYKSNTPTYFNGNEVRNFIIDKHSGLTVYGYQERYPYLNEKYKELSWYKKVFN